MAENVYRKKTKIFSGIVMVVSVALCLFQMYAGGISNISSMTLRTIHWTVISAVAIVSYPAVKGKETMRWYDYILLAASLFATIYVAVVWPTRTIQVSTNDPLFSTLDKVAFLVMTLVILEIARRTTGLALTVTAAIALIYLMFLGPYIPAPRVFAQPCRAVFAVLERGRLRLRARHECVVYHAVRPLRRHAGGGGRRQVLY